MCRLANCMYRSKLASDMLDSCKQYKYRDYFSKYWQLYWYVLFNAILYRLSQYYTEGISLTFITLSNKSFKNLTCVGKVQLSLRVFYSNSLIFIFLFPYIICASLHYELNEGPLETVRCDNKILFHVRS